MTTAITPSATPSVTTASGMPIRVNQFRLWDGGRGTVGQSSGAIRGRGGWCPDPIGRSASESLGCGTPNNDGSGGWKPSRA